MTIIDDEARETEGHGQDSHFIHHLTHQGKGFLQECANTDLKEFWIRNTYSVKESVRIDKTILCHFHKSHGNNPNECIHLKDENKDLIKREC